MKRPLLPVALIYAGGLLLAHVTEISLTPLFTVALAVAVAACVSTRLRPWLLPAAIFFFGWINLASRDAILSPDDVRLLLGDRRETVLLRGRLTETPAHRVFERDEKDAWRSLARLEFEAIRLGNRDWQPAHGEVMTSTTGILPRPFFRGQPVQIAGNLAPPRGPMADGVFDYRAWLRLQGIHYELKVSATNDWQLLGPPRSPPLTLRFREWAQRTLARGLPGEDEALRLQWAMVLGWKTALIDEVTEPFMRTGTMHIFAISGLHIALIAGILVTLLRALGVPRGFCAWLVIPLIWFYTAATDWQSSAIRSTVMMSIVIAGWSLKRPSDLLNSLFAAGLGILVWDPRQLFQASFQLSFFVVLSIALLMPTLDDFRREILKHDPLLPAELRPRWQRRLTWCLNHLTTALSTSFAAWLGSLPIIAWYFHLLTPVSLVANLVIVPLSSLALMCGLGSLMTGGWFPWATELFNHAGWGFMTAMEGLSGWFASLPGAYVHVAAPAPITFALYYAVLLGCFTGWVFRGSYRWWLRGGIAALGILWAVNWQHDRAVARVTVLPLNGGHAIHLHEARGTGDWLIDCGDAPAVEFVLKPFLRAQGVNRLPHLVLTHGDTRQIGGAERLGELFPVTTAYASAIRFRSPAYREAMSRFERKPGALTMLMNQARAGPWQVLHPGEADHFPQADDNALVLRGEIQGVRVLMLSDLGKLGQRALFERHPDLRADIVIAGLPQQGEPLADPLIERIQPKLIIVADSAFPASRRANPALRERLQRSGVPVLFTRDADAITLTLRAGNWTAQTMAARANRPFKK